MNGREQSDGSGLVLTIIFVLVLYCLGAGLVEQNQEQICRMVRLLISLEMRCMPACFPLADEASLSEKALALADLHELMRLLDRAGLPYALISAIGLLVLLVAGFRLSVRERYRRSHSMHSLLVNNVRYYPCLAPILNWGGSLLDEDPDRGPWRCGRQPIQFAAEHGLLLRRKDGVVLPKSLLLTSEGLADPASPLLRGSEQACFDRGRAQAVFEAQFGAAFTGFSALPAYLRALALAFILFGLGRKKESQRLLDRLSLSFRREQHPGQGLWARLGALLGKKGEKGPGRQEHYSLDGSLAMPESEVTALFHHPEVERVIRPHNRYVLLVLLALYAFARRKGVLCTAEFIWLKPVYRELFYLLNTYGRRTVWVEVAGPWVHYRAEEALGAKNARFAGQDISEGEKLVEGAVQGLEQALFEEGWIDAHKEKVS